MSKTLEGSPKAQEGGSVIGFCSATQAISMVYSGANLSSVKSYQMLVISKNRQARWLLDLRAKTSVERILRAWIPYSRKSQLAWRITRIFARFGLLRLLPGVSLISIPASSYGAWIDEFPALRSCVPIIFIGKPSVTAKLILFMCDGQENISAVVKLPLTVHATRSIATEAAALLELHEMLPNLPKVIGVTHLKGVSAQSWVEGESISRDLTGKHIELLARFPRSAKIASLQDRFFETSERLKLQYKGLISCAMPHFHKPITLPVVWEHGDFVPWNIKRAANGTLVLLDWEYSIAQGLPLLDLCHFFYRQDYLFHDLGNVHNSIAHSSLVQVYCSTFALGQDAVRALEAYYLLRSLQLDIPDTKSKETYAQFVSRQLSSLRSC